VGSGIRLKRTFGGSPHWVFITPEQNRCGSSRLMERPVPVLIALVGSFGGVLCVKVLRI